METRFYSGNYSLTLGQPYIIISAEERENEFYAEKIILFEGLRGVRAIKTERSYPKINPNDTLEKFISMQLDQSKDDIIFKVLHVGYNDLLEKNGYTYKIDMRETDFTLLSLFRNKFPDITTKIRETTNNKFLRDHIKLVESIKWSEDIDFK